MLLELAEVGVSPVEFAERTTTFAERTATCSENPVQKSLTALPNSAKSGTASKSPALILFCHEKVCVLFLLSELPNRMAGHIMQW